CHDEFNARQLRATEADAAIDNDPFAAARRSEAISGHVHADLADAAKRHKDEFIPLVLGHGYFLYCQRDASRTLVGGRRALSVVSFGRWPLPQNVHRLR